jgi:hypothetical protein
MGEEKLERTATSVETTARNGPEHAGALVDNRNLGSFLKQEETVHQLNLAVS